MDSEELSYKGEKFTIRWDPKEEILFEEMWGHHTIKDAEDYLAKFKEFCEKIPGTDPLKILVDVSKQEKTDSDARRVYTEASSHPRSGRSAICGPNIIIRLIAGFISTALGRKNIKTFASAKEGLKWLKGIETEKR